MNANDFVSADKIIAEVSQMVDDKEFKKGFSKGWFMSQIHNAIQELAFDTYYFKAQHDFELPEQLQIKMPQDVFNIREIYLYNGDFCNPQHTQVVYHKRLFNNNYQGDGYTAKVKDDGSNSSDPFQPNQRLFSWNHQGFYGLKYYYNVMNGLMMFSKDCGAFPYVRVIFNGMGGLDGSLPIIPRFFHRAIVDWVEERYYNAMKSQDIRKYRPLWTDAYTRLHDPRKGSWRQARVRVSSMDSAEKESMEEYISSMYHK
jgi:hypothetical protein